MAASTIISILSALLTIAKYLVTYMEQKRWIDEGAAKVLLNSLKESDDAVIRAQNARETVRLNNQRDPSSVLRDDDGYKRPDG